MGFEERRMNRGDGSLLVEAVGVEHQLLSGLLWSVE